jgi:hypothetical protein
MCRPKARLPRPTENDVNPATAIAQAAQFTKDHDKARKVSEREHYVPGVE